MWAQGEERLPEPPSYYYHRQIYSCFFKDTAGMKLLDEVGVDNVLFETDYPHSDGTFLAPKRLLTNCSATLSPRSCTRSLGATPSSCSTSARLTWRPPRPAWRWRPFWSCITLARAPCDGRCGAGGITL